MDSNYYFVITLSKGTPLPFDVTELSPVSPPSPGFFYFKLGTGNSNEELVTSDERERSRE